MNIHADRVLERLGINEDKFYEIIAESEYSGSPYILLCRT
jgi:hypothetical protein